MREETPLDVHVVGHEDRCLVVAVAGEVDHQSAGRLSATARVLLGRDYRDLVLDASHVTFCDSAGLAALVEVWRELARRRGTLAVVAPPDGMARILQLTGLDEIMPTHGTVSEALAGLGIPCPDAPA
jgi:anti-sigma B factor antagonist